MPRRTALDDSFAFAFIHSNIFNLCLYHLCNQVTIHEAGAPKDTPGCKGDKGCPKYTRSIMVYAIDLTAKADYEVAQNGWSGKTGEYFRITIFDSLLIMYIHSRVFETELFFMFSF